MKRIGIFVVLLLAGLLFVVAAHGQESKSVMFESGQAQVDLDVKAGDSVFVSAQYSGGVESGGILRLKVSKCGGTASGIFLPKKSSLIAYAGGLLNTASGQIPTVTGSFLASEAGTLILCAKAEASSGEISPYAVKLEVTR